MYGRGRPTVVITVMINLETKEWFILKRDAYLKAANTFIGYNVFEKRGKKLHKKGFKRRAARRLRMETDPYMHEHSSTKQLTITGDQVLCETNKPTIDSTISYFPGTI